MQEKIHGGLRYVVKYPKGFDENKVYPVVLFLHGAGSISNDIQVLINNKKIFKQVEELDLPCVLFAPHCDPDLTWLDNIPKLKDFVNMICELPYTDASRIYLTGNSMGGYGTWQLAMSMPNTFAAILPICGGGMYWYTWRLKDTPVWAFHGDADKVVLCDESRHMVDAINNYGGNAKLTVYPGCDHNSWDVTYSDPKVWDWVFSQKRKNI